MAALPPHPFTYSNADIAFRSSDNVVYKLHKLVLSIASDFFSDMFGLPQPTLPSYLHPPTQPSDEQEIDGLPVIPVSEPSHVLTPLFLLCYPLEEPNLASIAQVRAVLEAAIKYDLRKAVQIARRKLRELMPTAPLRVYAIACKLGFEDDARDAAKEVRLQKVQEEYAEELEEIPFGAYHRLLHYCATGRSSAPGQHFSFCHATTTAGTEEKPSRKVKRKVKRGHAAPTPSSTAAPSTSGTGESSTGTMPPVNGPSDSPMAPDHHPPQTAAVDSDEDGVVFVTSDDVRLRSLGNAILHVSPVLRALAAARPTITDDIYVPERSATMNVLIRIYDQFEYIEVTNLLGIYNALVAAVKYQMQKAIGFLQATLRSRQDSTPAESLFLYAVACHFEMHELALVTARATLRVHLTDTLRPDIDNVDISAGSLHRLLDYHRRCRAAITPIFETRDWLQGTWLHRVQNGPCGRAFLVFGSPSRAKWACWYDPYMKAAAASAAWPSSTSVTRDEVLHAGLAVNPPSSGPGFSINVASHCHTCMQGKGAVELFQFSQHVASTITALETEVDLIWPTVQKAAPVELESAATVETQPGRQ